MKKFALCEPSVADPVGLVPLVDITDPEHSVAYSSLDPLKTEIARREHDIAFREGENHESIRAQRYLTDELGWTAAQVRAFLFWRPNAG